MKTDSPRPPNSSLGSRYRRGTFRKRWRSPPGIRSGDAPHHPGLVSSLDRGWLRLGDRCGDGAELQPNPERLPLGPSDANDAGMDRLRIDRQLGCTRGHRSFPLVRTASTSRSVGSCRRECGWPVLRERYRLAAPRTKQRRQSLAARSGCQTHSTSTPVGPGRFSAAAPPRSQRKCPTSSRSLRSRCPSSARRFPATASKCRRCLPANAMCHRSPTKPGPRRRASRA
jgi:hypothetical protein